MKNVIKLLSAAMLVFMASHSFAQTTPVTTDPKVPVQGQIATPAGTTIQPSTSQEPSKANSENEQKFAASHPKFDKLDQNHPQVANHIYNHRSELQNKGMTGKDVYQDRSKIKQHAEKRAQDKKQDQKSTGTTTPQTTPTPQQ